MNALRICREWLYLYSTVAIIVFLAPQIMSAVSALGVEDERGEDIRSFLINASAFLTTTFSFFAILGGAWIDLLAVQLIGAVLLLVLNFTSTNRHEQRENA